MITEIREIYKCEHCRKVYQIKRYAIEHEIKCRKNPDNKQACIWCIFLEKKKVEYIYNTYIGERECIKEIMFCNKLKKGVYPFWCKNPLLEWDIIGEIPNEIMPKKCDHFKH